MTKAELTPEQLEKRKEYSRQYYQKNREKIKLIQANKYQKRKHLYKKVKHEWYLKNRQKCIERATLSRLNKNKEESRAYWRKRYQLKKQMLWAARIKQNICKGIPLSTLPPEEHERFIDYLNQEVKKQYYKNKKREDSIALPSL